MSCQQCLGCEGNSSPECNGCGYCDPYYACAGSGLGIDCDGAFAMGCDASYETCQQYCDPENPMEGVDCSGCEVCQPAFDACAGSGMGSGLDCEGIMALSCALTYDTCQQYC